MSSSIFLRNAELLEQYRAGDKSARDMLVVENKRLIMKYARRYSFDGHYCSEDLFQEGCIGLMNAIDHYDLSYDVSFGTYATFWIRQAMIRYIQNQGRTIRLPSHVHEKISTYKKAVEGLTDYLGRKPTVMETAQSLGVNIIEIEKLRMFMLDVDSLDKPIGEDEDGTTTGDMVRDESGELEELADKIDLVIQIRKAVQKLKEKERDIITARYGIDRKPEKAADIGTRLHVTGSGVYFIERQALRKLRRMAELREYRINRSLDDITNFHRNTERVVLWREKQRLRLYGIKGMTEE